MKVDRIPSGHGSQDRLYDVVLDHFCAADKPQAELFELPASLNHHNQERFCRSSPFSFALCIHPVSGVRVRSGLSQPSLGRTFLHHTAPHRMSSAAMPPEQAKTTETRTIRPLLEEPRGFSVRPVRPPFGSPSSPDLRRSSEEIGLVPRNRVATSPNVRETEGLVPRREKHPKQRLFPLKRDDLLLEPIDTPCFTQWSGFF